MILFKIILIVDNIYSGQIEFSGSNKELNIDRFFLKNKFFDLNAEINIMDLLSEDIEINTIINSLKINEEFLRTNYEIDEKIDLPLLQGNLVLKIKFNI